MPFKINSTVRNVALQSRLFIRQIPRIFDQMMRKRGVRFLRLGGIMLHFSDFLSYYEQPSNSPIVVFNGIYVEMKFISQKLRIIGKMISAII